MMSYQRSARKTYSLLGPWTGHRILAWRYYQYRVEFHGVWSTYTGCYQVSTGVHRSKAWGLTVIVDQGHFIVTHQPRNYVRPDCNIEICSPKPTQQMWRAVAKSRLGWGISVVHSRKRLAIVGFKLNMGFRNLLHDLKRRTIIISNCKDLGSSPGYGRHDLRLSQSCALDYSWWQAERLVGWSWKGSLWFLKKKQAPEVSKWRGG